ncbi:MAG: S-adenosylmethionine:tRNA ribosyltransferase-isomerase, partial [Nitrospirae bacterium]|nr:S-adenosylmethionine:tRNA ribosyltransferase-isomerase [Nitrospirota bacterium]
RQRYQTVYAEHQGSIAAPTAGLHFTEELLGKIRDKGVFVETLTLHVGIGTFKSVKAEFLSGHRMDREYFEIKTSLESRISKVKEAGRRLLAVGTTTTRAIETVVSGQWSAVSSKRNGSNSLNGLNGILQGYTDIFIHPGYMFKAVDGLITNFHLPRSTPLMLTSALCSFKKLNKAYEEAIAMGYRFFSYGDAMLIL